MMFDRQTIEHVEITKDRTGIKVMFNNGSSQYYRFLCGELDPNVTKEFEDGYVEFFLEYLERATNSSKRKLILGRPRNVMHQPVDPIILKRK